MEWTVVSCVLFAIFLSIKAEPVVTSSSPEDKSLPPALVNQALSVRAEAQLTLMCSQGGAGKKKKKRPKAMSCKLPGPLNAGDLTREKEEREEEDRKLKEELGEFKAWVTKELDKGQEEPTGGALANKEITELKEAFGKLQDSVKQAAQQSSAVDDLKQQMSDFQAELKSTQQQLQTAPGQLSSPNASGGGSLFIRWGHGQCPSSTSLVYSGVAGGSWYRSSGGGSNYLCLGMTPETEDTPLSLATTGLHGAEYQNVPGRDDQDVVCSVCRAPQATTLMIPATRTCPSGWTAQYTGYLMTGYWNHRGRTEFVCVDEGREFRQGGGANKNGALFYPSIIHCGSLPCPPYAANKVVTCVVCSV
ncbi:uncharacterized protein LOC143289450 [Babylonia areolata]|uniref:uncharacterized protein LOC143289450 n=1 Tax=Babylonia areolata TaxID=304850 RepID=UPI003FD29E18